MPLNPSLLVWGFRCPWGCSFIVWPPKGYMRFDEVSGLNSTRNNRFWMGRVAGHGFYSHVAFFLLLFPKYSTQVDSKSFKTITIVWILQMFCIVKDSYVEFLKVDWRLLDCHRGFRREEKKMCRLWIIFTFNISEFVSFHFAFVLKWLEIKTSSLLLRIKATSSR